MGTGKAQIPTQQIIKALHRKEIFLNILHSGMLSRAQLKKQMKLSFPSVSALVEEMIGQNILTETGTAETKGRGRPQIMLRVNPAAAAIPVVSITREGYVCTVFDAAVQPVETCMVPFMQPWGSILGEDGRWYPEMDALCTPLEQWMERLKSRFPVSVLLLSAGGAFDESGVFSSSSLRMKIPAGFLTRLRERLSLEIVFGNKVDPYAYAERLSQQLPEDYVYLYVGQGVGMGLIRQGKVYGGYHDRVGEIGHMTIDYRGRPCGCGSRGCLERYVELSAIASDAGLPDFQAVCKAFQAGEPAVTALLREKAELLVCGINNMLAMHPVCHIVLGGGIEALGEGFLEMVRDSIRHTGRRRFREKVTVVYTQNQPGAEARGAVWNYFENEMELDRLLRL